MICQILNLLQKIDQLSCDLVILVKGLLNPIMKTLSREDDIFKRRLREAIETPTLNRDTG